MKVLHIIDSLGLGGAQTVVKGIFEGQKSSEDICLYALRKRVIRMEIDHENIMVHDSTCKFSFPLFGLKKIIAEKHIEVLHCHLAKSQIIGWVLKVLFFPNITLIFHEHGQIFESGRIYPFLMNFFRKRTDLYIAVSEATKKKILSKTRFSAEKIRVLYNFVDLDRFKKRESFDRNKARAQYGLSEKDFVFGFAGRLVEKKGWKEYVYTAKGLIDQGYDLKFLIAGDGYDKNEVLKSIRGYEDSMQYVGYLRNMTEFYHTIDCFVFPSHVESMGITGIEANACSCPVIASDIEGLNEVMLDSVNALLFQARNVPGLIEKMVQMHEDASMRNALRNAGLVEVRKYDLNNYLTKLHAIYERI